MSTGHKKAMEQKRRINILDLQSSKTEKEIQEYKHLTSKLGTGGENNYIGLDNPLHPRNASK